MSLPARQRTRCMAKAPDVRQPISKLNMIEQVHPVYNRTELLRLN
jgi:hypothetical protein